MKYYIEEKQNKKIGIFSDLHIGVSSDSKLRLTETVKCCKWIIEKFKSENVDWIIFCGDLFNSRYSINVNTLNIGISLIEKFSENFERVFLIAGNHDTYYKNTNEINSVKLFQKFNTNKNVVVIDQDPMFLDVNGLKLGLYPWEYDLDKVKLIENYVTPDYGFGHFEMNGVELTGSISSGSKYNLSDLFILGKTLFSGHYHGNKLYTDKNKQQLYMIGSPLQLDWGDYKKDKKIITLNTLNKEIKEFKNKINAKFEKLFYSCFEKGEYDEDTLIKLCKNNFIKLVMDSKYQIENVIRFNMLIKDFDPHTIELDYLISISNEVITESTDEMIKASSKTNKDYLIEYLEKAFPEYEKVNENLNLLYLKEMAESYYNKSLLDKNEQQEIEL
jgi:DNA repair exonuclease SbcCD nuclease subunit